MNLTDEEVAEVAEHGLLGGSHARSLAREVQSWRAMQPTFTSVVHQCCEDKQKLLEALREAREMLADWSQYADPYFRAKHKLNDDLAEVDAVIARYTE